MIGGMAQNDNSPQFTQVTTGDVQGLPDFAAPAFSPLYQQIKGLILKSLQGGEWKPGEAIPSEMDLAARYRVSQGTVRKAIDALAADNLVVEPHDLESYDALNRSDPDSPIDANE